MKAIIPIEVTDETLFHHSVSAEDDVYAAWASGSTYSEGDRVYLLSTHRIYESIANLNSNKSPDTNPEWWVDIGPTNRWAMFDQTVGSSTAAENVISVTIKLEDLDNVTAVGLIDLTAANRVVIEILDGALGSTSLSGSPTTSVSGSGAASLSGSPTTSPSASVSSSISASPSESVSSSLSNSPSESLSASPSTSISGSISASPSVTYSKSASPSVSPTTSPSGSLSASPSSSISGSPTTSPSESISNSPSASVSASPYPVGVRYQHDQILGDYDTDAYDWYSYFFSPLSLPSAFALVDIPYFPDSLLRVTVYGGTDLSIGTLIFGNAKDLGTTLWGAELGIIDYSMKETDDFGITTIMVRDYAKKMSCDLFIKHRDLRATYRFFGEARATACLWVGSTDPLFDSTIIYGFYKDFSINLQDYGGSFCSLEIEGLI